MAGQGNGSTLQQTATPAAAAEAAIVHPITLAAAK
jgi:hypothetical protein